MRNTKTKVFSGEYGPSEDESYMNERQLKFFRGNLEDWRLQTQVNLEDMEAKLQELNASDERDESDKAFIESEVAITINKISNCQTLLREIDIALEYIKEGGYGFCKKTGKQIGLKRLMAKPTSIYCFQAQEDEEKSSKKRLENQFLENLEIADGE